MVTMNCNHYGKVTQAQRGKGWGSLETWIPEIISDVEPEAQSLSLGLSGAQKKVLILDKWSPRASNFPS